MAKEKVLKNCGNCGNEVEDLGEGRYYCKECNQTFAVVDGKVTVDKGTNLIQRMADTIRSQGEDIDKLKGQINPEGGIFF